MCTGCSDDVIEQKIVVDPNLATYDINKAALRKMDTGQPISVTGIIADTDSLTMSTTTAADSLALSQLCEIAHSSRTSASSHRASMLRLARISA